MNAWKILFFRNWRDVYQNPAFWHLTSYGKKFEEAYKKHYNRSFHASLARGAHKYKNNANHQPIRELEMTKHIPSPSSRWRHRSRNRRRKLRPTIRRHNSSPKVWMQTTNTPHWAAKPMTKTVILIPNLRKTSAAKPMPYLRGCSRFSTQYDNLWPSVAPDTAC